MEPYNNTIFGLIDGKTCTHCGYKKSKVDFSKKSGKCKECVNILGAMKGLEIGRTPLVKNWASPLNGYKYCGFCKNFEKLDHFNKAGCKLSKSESDKKQREKVKNNPKKHIESKKCCKCNQEKVASEFAKNNSSINGLSAECKQCKREFDKKYREENFEKVKQAKKKCYKNNKEHYSDLSKKWGAKNPEKRKKIALNFYKRKAATEHGRIEIRLSANIKNCFKKAGNYVASEKWKKELGYTPMDLKIHLEQLFTEGMNWDLFLSGKIHIDHIIPKSSFVYTSEEDLDFKECWNLKNLRPAWNTDNWEKNDLLPDGTRGRDIKRRKLKNLAEPDDISAFACEKNIFEENCHF
jgi:hypothetical protein